MRTLWLVLVACFLAFVIWMLPEPVGVERNGWELFALFTATMTAIVLRVAPMGLIALISLAVAVAFQLLTFEEAFSGFSSEVVWLVVFAFLIARGFISTGLGNRIAYRIMGLFGKNSLGVGYGLVATDFILAPMIPSFTARAGGIIYPIARSLTDVFTGPSHDPKMGSFLATTAFQGAIVTSGMFLTSMAGNPLILELAKGQGIELTWATWALAAVVPGMLSLLVVPYLLYCINPPTIRQTPHAREMALKHLHSMGPMKREEWIMCGTFALLLGLWTFGSGFGLTATVSAMIGLSVLLITGVLKWKDILGETNAWDTFIWFGTFITLSQYLNDSGLANWFADVVAAKASGFGWVGGFLLLTLVYFYAHYFFASKVAHIGAMYTPFLVAAIALGTPPALAALALGFSSALFGGLTNYSSGPAPIFFNMSGLSTSQWWKIGFTVSVVNLAIWLILGSLWWKVIGFW